MKLNPEFGGEKSSTCCKTTKEEALQQFQKLYSDDIELHREVISVNPMIESTLMEAMVSFKNNVLESMKDAIYTLTEECKQSDKGEVFHDINKFIIERIDKWDSLDVSEKYTLQSNCSFHLKMVTLTLNGILGTIASVIGALSSQPCGTEHSVETLSPNSRL